LCVELKEEKVALLARLLGQKVQDHLNKSLTSRGALETPSSNNHKSTLVS
jgi:hypothetical protein